MKTTGILGLALVALLGILESQCNHQNSPGQLWARQPEHELTDDTVRGTGRLTCLDSIRIANKTGTETTIVYLAEDHSQVTQGDLVVQLDDSKLQQQLAEQTIVAEIAKQGLQASSIEWQLLDSKLKSTRELAKLKLNVALLNRQRILGQQGRLELAISDTRHQLKFAQNDLTQAQTELPVAKAAGEGDSTRLKKATHQVEHLERKLRFLQGPEIKYQTAATELAIHHANVELEQSAADLKFLTKQHESNLQSQQVKVQLELETLAQIQTQIDSCNIYAPQDGQFVYAHHLNRRGQFDRDPVEIGAMVRDRENVAVLPDRDRLQVSLLIAESMIARVQRDQSATIRFESIPGQLFEGTVVSVGGFPDPASRYGKTKQYAVVVSIYQPPAKLSLGAKANVEIKVDKDE